MKNSILLLSLFDVDFESQNLPGRLVHWIEVSNEYWETIFKNSVPQLCRSDHFLLPYSGKLSKGANFRIIQIRKHCLKF